MFYFIPISDSILLVLSVVLVCKVFTHVQNKFFSCVKMHQMSPDFVAMLIKATDFNVDYHLFAMGVWKSYLTSLNFMFFICKIVIVISVSHD